MKTRNIPAGQLVFLKICGNDKSLRIRRRKVTELWRKTVNESLGIDKEIYALNIPATLIISSRLIIIDREIKMAATP